MWDSFLKGEELWPQVTEGPQTAMLIDILLGASYLALINPRDDSHFTDGNTESQGANTVNKKSCHLQKWWRRWWWWWWKQSPQFIDVILFNTSPLCNSWLLESESLPQSPRCDRWKKSVHVSSDYFLPSSSSPWNLHKGPRKQSCHSHFTDAKTDSETSPEIRRTLSPRTTISPKSIHQIPLLGNVPYHCDPRSDFLWKGLLSFPLN